VSVERSKRMTFSYLEGFNQLSQLIIVLQQQLDILLLTPYDTAPARRARQLLTEQIEELRGLRWLLIVPNSDTNVTPTIFTIGGVNITFRSKST
jgi:hypothetical protein